jgi:hypothetical protein
MGVAMLFTQSDTERPGLSLRTSDRLALGLVGAGVIFACLGLGEAVYRVLFLEFEGATDRLPIEMVFGLAFAFITIRLAKKVYQNRLKTSAEIASIRQRTSKIRHAVEAIRPVPYSINHQAIRVIREEVDRIEYALTEQIPQ